MGAREEILRLIDDYCFTIDAGDLDGFASLFEHGEWIISDGPPHRGREDVLRALSSVRIYDDGTPRTKHLTCNVELEIDEDAGTAAGQCYIVLLQQTDDLPLQPIVAAHYFDEFERVDGTWRFRRRAVRNRLVGDVSAHVGAPLGG